MKYSPQLDGIRGLAVILVVVEHWGRVKRFTNIPLGDIGVDIFFVLSGFLISTILLEAKEAQQNSNNLRLVKHFYIRRTLRIFPLYYLVISLWFFARYLSNIPIDDSPYYYLYVSNFYMFSHDGGKLVPTWSLAVEEQFYIIWPWLIIFLSKKKIFKAILTFIIIGIVSKYIFWLAFNQNEKILLFTPTCFDSFGIGALLAYAKVCNYNYSRFRPLVSILALLSLISIIILAIQDVGNGLYTRLLTAILTIYIIDLSFIPNPSNFLTKIISNKRLIFMGKISYGIYLIHNLVPPVWDAILAKSTKIIQIPFINFFPLEQLKQPIIFTQYGIVLILICTFSWRYFESKLINLKKYFDY